MVKKLQKLSADKKSGAQLTSAVRESAQQIWLAGLGAFAKAQEEGGKVFETLVKEGLSMQRKTQSAAEERLSEATTRVATMASDIGARAAGQWDKLENIFEDRVARALNKLGVPSAKDVEALIERIDDLTRSVQALSGNGAAKPAAPAAKPKARPARAAKAPKAAPATVEEAAPAVEPAPDAPAAPTPAAKKPARRAATRKAAA